MALHRYLIISQGGRHSYLYITSQTGTVDSALYYRDRSTPLDRQVDRQVDPPNLFSRFIRGFITLDVEVLVLVS